MLARKKKICSALLPTQVDYVVELIRQKKGKEIVILNLEKVASFTDYLVICTVESNRQAQTISDHILESLKDEKIRPLNIEGYNQARWILMDYIDFLVNIFDTETRNFYQLEKLWRDAPATVVPDENI